MFMVFLAALVGAGLVELTIRLAIRLTQGSASSPRRSILESSINIISIAVGYSLGSQLALQLESTWQVATVVVLSVGVVVTLGQVVVHYYKKAQQNTPTDRA
jgi:uncharacterized membrane protein